MYKEWGIELLQEGLEKGNDLRFRALGSSMFPSIRSGDVITVKPVESAAICVGDVVFYRRDGRVYAHRFIGKKRVNGGLLFITRGDHLPFSDPPIGTFQILGKVVVIERRGKRISMGSCPIRLANYIIARISPFWLYRLLYVLVRFKQALIKKM